MRKKENEKVVKARKRSKKRKEEGIKEERVHDEIRYTTKATFPTLI